MRRLITVLCMIVYSITACAQQSPLFSFYPFHHIPVNPAMTGAEGHFNITASHRMQWIGKEGAPVTELLTAETILKNPSMGVGFSSLYDKIGVSANWQNMGHFMYRVRMKGWLSFALSAGFAAYRNNFDRLVLYHQADPAFNTAENQIHLTTGAGIFYLNKKFGAGISVPTLQPANIGFSEAFRSATWNAHAHYSQQVSENLILQPQFLLRIIPGTAAQADIGLKTEFREQFIAGLFYRTKNAFAGLIQYRITEKLMVGYAYDKGIRIGMYQLPSSHEFLLRFDLRKKISTPDVRFF